MRVQRWKADEDNGLYRWDLDPTPDPTRVCYTCRYFGKKDGTCGNEIKQFFNADRKVLHARSMRCVDHEFVRDFELYLKHEDHCLDVGELRSKIQDLRFQLEDLESVMKFKETYKELFAKNPFENRELAGIRDAVKNEIDVTIRYHKFYKHLPNDISIDNLDMDKIKVFKNTIWLYGIIRRTEYMDPVHSSLKDKEAVKFSFNLDKQCTVTFYKNGEKISTGALGAKAILTTPDLLDKALSIHEEYMKIRQVVAEVTRVPYMEATGRYWHLEFETIPFMNNKYVDLEHFTKTVDLLKFDKEGDGYRQFKVKLWMDGERVKAKFETDHVFSVGSFTKFVTIVEPKLAKELPGVDLVLDEEERQLIEEAATKAIQA